MAASREVLLQTQKFQVVRQYRDLPDGGRQAHDSVQHPGAVAIVPLLEGERICLIRNYRLAVGEWLIELPAGTLEPGEPPLETARRELQEETGYRCREIRLIHEFLMSPGILNERMHLYLATGLEAGPPDLQPDEQIQKLIVPIDEALAMTADGRIRDAKTLLGLLLFARG